MNRLRRPASRRSFYIGLAICLGIVGFFLVLEHRAHVIPYVPYLLLALCPLLHMFMHRGHGGQRKPIEEPGMDHSSAQDLPAYGLWTLVIINSAVFLIFVFSFTRPKRPRDWRSFGAFSAFIVAMFVEMYGFPVTIYLLAGWLQSRYPRIDPFSHQSGHLWHTILGISGDAHSTGLHVAANVLIFGAFILLATSWRVLHAAQQRHELATVGPYAFVRHPQYAALILLMLGFLLMWPTILTALMFPILVYMYVRLARHEEREMASEFGEAYRRYAESTPAFVPRPSAANRPSGRTS
jgi:protein-S-isoprenylcysteine O-methyltransferase Ste14